MPKENEDASEQASIPTWKEALATIASAIQRGEAILPTLNAKAQVGPGATYYFQHVVNPHKERIGRLKQLSATYTRSVVGERLDKTVGKNNWTKKISGAIADCALVDKLCDENKS
jgi:hypothetical protein